MRGAARWRPLQLSFLAACRSASGATSRTPTLLPSVPPLPAHSAVLAPLAASPNLMWALHPELGAAMTASHRRSLLPRLLSLLAALPRPAPTQPPPSPSTPYPPSSAPPLPPSEWDPLQLDHLQCLPPRMLQQLCIDCGLWAPPPTPAAGVSPAHQLDPDEAALLLHDLLLQQKAGGGQQGQWAQGHDPSSPTSQTAGGSAAAAAEEGSAAAAAEEGSAAAAAAAAQAAAGAAADALFDLELQRRMALAVVAAAAQRGHAGRQGGAAAAPPHPLPTLPPAPSQPRGEGHPPPPQQPAQPGQPASGSSECWAAASSSPPLNTDHTALTAPTPLGAAPTPSLPPPPSSSSSSSWAPGPWPPPDEFRYLDPGHPYAPPPDKVSSRRDLPRRLRRLLAAANYPTKQATDPAALMLLKPHQLAALCEECEVDVDAPSLHLLHARRALRLTQLVLEEQGGAPPTDPHPSAQLPPPPPGSSPLLPPLPLPPPPSPPPDSSQAAGSRGPTGDSDPPAAAKALAAESGPQEGPGDGSREGGMAAAGQRGAAGAGAGSGRVEGGAAAPSQGVAAAPLRPSQETGQQPGSSATRRGSEGGVPDAGLRPAATTAGHAAQLARAQVQARLLAAAAPPREVAAWLVAARAQQVLLLSGPPRPPAPPLPGSRVRRHGLQGTDTAADTAHNQGQAGSRAQPPSPPPAGPPPALTSSQSPPCPSPLPLPLRAVRDPPGSECDGEGGHSSSRGGALPLTPALVVATASSRRHAAACLAAVRWQIGQRLAAAARLAPPGSLEAAVAASTPLPDLSGAGGNSDWMALEAGLCSVHVLTAPARAYYNLEEKWSGGPRALADAACRATVHTVDTAAAAAPATINESTARPQMTRDSATEAPDDSDAAGQLRMEHFRSAGQSIYTLDTLKLPVVHSSSDPPDHGAEAPVSATSKLSASAKSAHQPRVWAPAAATPASDSARRAVRGRGTAPAGKQGSTTQGPGQSDTGKTHEVVRRPLFNTGQSPDEVSSG